MLITQNIFKIKNRIKTTSQLYMLTYKHFFFKRQTANEEHQEKQEFKHFTQLREFLTERAKYNWEDYHQQILVNYFMVYNQNRPL